MNYSSNRLEDFEFHDAKCTLHFYNENTLSFFVQHLNIHHNAEQNPFDDDMEIGTAVMTLEGFHLQSFCTDNSLIIDEKGKQSTVPPAVFKGENALDKLLDELQSEIWIFDLGQMDQTAYYMDAGAIEPFFTLVFSFDRVTIEWDSYLQKAWYTQRRKI